MDHHAVSRPRGSLAPPTSDAQENQEPVQLKRGEKRAVVASGLVVKPQTSNNSSPVDSNQHKHRRALHSIDSNRPRPVVHLPLASSKHQLSGQPPRALNIPLEAKKRCTPSGQVDHAVNTFKSFPTDPKTIPAAAVIGHKRPMTATADVVKSPEQMKPSERQESENLAWMDMMLALLERRYGSHSNLPVCVSDLEAANMFQSPSPKRYKADIAPVAQPTPFDSNNVARPRISLENSIAQVNVGQHQATGGAAVTRRSQATVDEKSLTLNTQQIPARFSQEQEEQAKEEKRQRLLLRHAQQIQSSSVSSSTSCGCKTGCLKMYCMCFSSRGFCHSGCACEDCKNSRNNKTERVEAIQSYLANDPRSFSFASLPRDANKTGFLHLLPQKSSAVVMRGCRCKKSKCLKKYCECFQNGIACTAHCRCMDCSNHCESSVAHEHHHLQKGSATSHGKHAYSGAGVSSNDRPKPFHPVQITVTKQPRRNRVSKTLRLNL